MKKAFVTGWPISHSKSPILHGYWLKELDIEGSYEAIAVESEKFENFITRFMDQGFVGGNITIPHKEQAFDLIKNKSSAAEAIGAVNTVWLDDDGIKADNTDAYGFMANLDQLAPNWRKLQKATIIGAGGASRAIIYALMKAGFQEVRIANRTLARAVSLVDQFKGNTSAHPLEALGELLPSTDLLVNTSAIGMAGAEEPNMIDVETLPDHAFVTDIVYTPLETPLLKAAAGRGLTTIDGLGMLLHQAAPGFAKWFGKMPSVTDKLREHILEAS